MGKLAMWGAVAGGAKGYQKEIANRYEKEAAALDEQRQLRMQKMKEAHDEKMAGRSEAHAEKLQGMRGTQAIEQIDATGESQINVVEATMTGRGTLQDDEQLFVAAENRLDRESRENIAKFGSSAAARNAARRFEAKVLSVGEANEYGIMVETDTPGVYDKESGTWFLQEGDKLVLPNAKPPANGYARPNKEHIQNLYKNPDKILEFTSKFGYAPVGILTLLNRAGQPEPTE